MMCSLYTPEVMNNMDNKYIGVFDSGLGGLTAVKKLIKVLPDENIIYFGDTARVPYGTRSDDTIVKYVKSDIAFLNTFDIKMILVACGTASTVALEKLKGELNVPAFGVVEASVLKAASATKTGKILVLGTPGTIKSGKYEKYLKEINPEFTVYSKACPLFVPLVENGYTDCEVAHLVAYDYLEEFLDKDIDTVILGCTHYPLLKKVIGNIVGGSVKLIDPGAELAEYAKDYLTQNNMLCKRPLKNQYKYFISDEVEGFLTLANRFLGKNINANIEKIDIEKY